MSEEAEARLQRLVTANLPQNRTQWAKAWQKEGGKVVGVLCTYVPVEVLIAADVMPWRVSGTWSQNVEDAIVMRAANSCGYCNHVLQGLLEGDMDFLDGVVATTWEQDITRLWDVWAHLGKTKFNHILHLPHYYSAVTAKFYAGEITEFVTAVEGFAGRQISDADLRRAIAIANRRRALMQQVYELRKRDVPPLSGAETLGLAVAGTLMPVEQFNKEIEALLPYLRERKAPLAALTPRVLISSDFADNPEFVDMVESAGCVVAMDDFDTGSRYYGMPVDENGKEPSQALAERYLGRTGTARMVSWEHQVGRVVDWVKEYRIQGVIELAQRYSRAREMRRAYFLEQLQKAGIQALGLEREYVPDSAGQLRTRVQAFVEMLDSAV